MCSLQPAILLLLFVVFISSGNGMPTPSSDVAMEICERSDDDYYRPDEEEFDGIMQVINVMMVALSTKLKSLKLFYIDNFIDYEEFCGTNEEYNLLLMSSNISENVNHSTPLDKLSKLNKKLSRMYNLVKRISEEEEDASVQERLTELLFNPEFGMVGMICFVDPYIPQDNREEARMTPLDATTQPNRADQLCKHFSMIDAIYKLSM